jgi:hypothetical protein
MFSNQLGSIMLDREESGGRRSATNKQSARQVGKFSLFPRADRSIARSDEALFEPRSRDAGLASISAKTGA